MSIFDFVRLGYQRGPDKIRPGEAMKLLQGVEVLTPDKIVSSESLEEAPGRRA